MRFRLRHHRRAWYQEKDGTFLRNCPLIMSERDRAMYTPGLTEELAQEWRDTFWHGVQRKAELGKHDYVVQAVSFRKAYPNSPGLWVLDEMDA